MLEIFPNTPTIDFVRLRRPAFILSAVLLLAGFVSLVVKGGPNYGIDFAGGLLVHVRVDPSVTTDEIRAAAEAAQAGSVSIQQFESQPGEYLLRVATADEEVGGGVAGKLKESLKAAFATRGYEELRTEIVGPQVGENLRWRAILAVVFSTIAMGIYIALRFDFWFGVGAGVALFHDVLVTVGALSIFNVEVDLSVLAALLTIVGYSVNDTVVVSDRIRENLYKEKKKSLGTVINESLNQTLARTLLTGGTTFFVLLTLFFVGGGVIHGFAFTLLVGLVIATYSSIFIASPVVEMWSGHGGALIGDR
jgi:preprotein translocase subunit SecF